MGEANRRELSADEVASQRFAQLQEAGAKRHPQTWLMANTHAVAAVTGLLDLSRPANKLMVTRIVLAVCDATCVEERQA